MKIERLLAIIMLLINRDRVTSNELADYFEVSKRTIIRDMEAINAAGIPIVSHQGKNGGFSLMENYRVDRSFLSMEEICSLITALQGVTKSYDDKNISSIMEKVNSLLPDSKKDTINKEIQKLIVDFSPWGGCCTQKEKVKVLKNALDENKLVLFKYTNSSGVTLDRIVEPVSLVLKTYSWYLYGYCRSRGDFRFFKLSRLKELQVLDEKFPPRDVDIKKMPWEEQWTTPNTEQKMILKFSPKAKCMAEEYFQDQKTEALEDGSLIVTINYPEDEWVYGMILSYGSEVEVLEPEHIRDIIKERADRKSVV